MIMHIVTLYVVCSGLYYHDYAYSRLCFVAELASSCCSLCSFVACCCCCCCLSCYLSFSFVFPHMLVFCGLQIQPMQMKTDSFWARANEDAFASHDLFQDIEKAFATGRGTVHVYRGSSQLYLYSCFLSPNPSFLLPPPQREEGWRWSRRRDSTHRRSNSSKF